jgi:GPH family glycoside/pentoside/hexuronide:cation symporter
MSSLSFKEKAGYAMGDVASNVVWQAMMYFLAFFYTDIYGISPAVVGTLFLVVRAFDAFVDPAMGILADRTNTRWGKFRPYLLWLAIPYGVFGVLMFTTPQLGNTGKIIFAYFTYTLMMVIYSAIMIPYNALSGVLTSDHIDRTSLNSFRFIGAFIGGIIIQALTIRMVDYFGASDKQTGYQITMGIFGILSIVMFLGTFFSVRERIKPDPNQHTSIGQDFKDLLQNKPWLILFFLSLFTLLYVCIRNGVALYYFEYFVQRKDLATSFMVTNSVIIIATLPFVKPLTRILGKKNLYMICMILIGITTSLFYFAGPTDIILIFALQVIFSIASAPPISLCWAMYADTADYSEWKTGRRATALIFSASTFAQKFGTAVGGAITMWLLAYYNYKPNVEQPADTLHGIKMIMSVYPAIGVAIGIILLSFYKLSDQKLVEIEEDLKTRKLQE